MTTVGTFGSRELRGEMQILDIHRKFGWGVGSLYFLFLNSLGFLGLGKENTSVCPANRTKSFTST